tara:strand:- start:7453 stop:7770 length:318 start_codon:yes stop_codon:yes gene_type:complete
MYFSNNLKETDFLRDEKKEISKYIRKDKKIFLNKKTKIIKYDPYKIKSCNAIKDKKFSNIEFFANKIIFSGLINASTNIGITPILIISKKDETIWRNIKTDILSF